MPIRASISTVTVPAVSQDLTTLTDVKSELKIYDNKEDTWLSRQIKAASAAASNYCNRVFAAETLVDQFWPYRDFSSPELSGVEPLQLSRYPSISVSSIVENSVTLVAGTDYLSKNADGTVIRIGSNSYPRGWPACAITVTYSAGYASIPVDIADAVIRLVKMRHFARGRDPAIRSETIPGVREVQWWIASGDDAGAMPPEVQDLLNNYRVPTVVG